MLASEVSFLAGQASDSDGTRAAAWWKFMFAGVFAVSQPAFALIVITGARLLSTV
jgi:hypothetical protein